MLDRIVQKEQSKKIYVMYDIACTLFSHLKVEACVSMYWHHNFGCTVEPRLSEHHCPQ